MFFIPLYLRLSGLAEVMAALGVEKLDKLMPDVVQTASKVDIASHVRDGYIMMFIYLPLTFGEKFTPYVGPIIPCILKVRRHDRKLLISHRFMFNEFENFMETLELLKIYLLINVYFNVKKLFTFLIFRKIIKILI